MSEVRIIGTPADHDPAGVSEALATVLRENGLTDRPDKYDGNIHSWRCEHPDRYGPCDCFQELVDDLARIVAERVRAVEVERDGLRARLGRVEALAAEMEGYDYPLSARYYAGRLRAALGDRGAEGADAGAEGAASD